MKEPETGRQIQEALIAEVRERVEGKVRQKPNPSKTYTRLQADGSTFAYVFPPGEARVAVKIPRQLLEVESSLPKGHGFKRTKYGLTRSLRSVAEAKTAARALAVAAAATAKAEAGAVA